MAKQVNARIAQKIDSLENWKKATGFVPLEGEFFLVNDRDCPISIGDGKIPASTLSNKALFDKVSEERLTAEFSKGKFYVSGVWKFNETLVNIPNKKTEFDVVYTMGNDITYNGLSFIYTDTMFPTDEPEIEFYAGGDWNDDAFRIIDFGTEPQEVSEEFYLWVKANAVKQETKVSGKWYFNETIVDELDTQTVNFIVDSRVYNKLSAKAQKFLALHFMLDTEDAFHTVSVWNGGTGWVLEAYRLIDFGTTPQTVNADFYNWLTQNAICLESANQLLDIEGLKIYDAMLRGIIDKKAENVEATTTVAGLMSAADKAKLDTLTETQLQKLLALIVDDNELNTMLEEVLV